MGITVKESAKRGGDVSFHSINIPSEWELTAELRLSDDLFEVSIQLISPASGNLLRINCQSSRNPFSFHSINIPSEWEFRGRSWRQNFSIVSIQLISPASGNFKAFCHCVDHFRVRFHSINIPSEWEFRFIDAAKGEGGPRFHSINIPSEWEYLGAGRGKRFRGMFYVSIQLISPASGNSTTAPTVRPFTCFHSINIPSEWEWKGG